MPEWRDIKPVIHEHAEEILRAEAHGPRWWKEAERLDSKEFEQFCDKCQEICGLFCNDKLTTCIFIEKQTHPEIIFIHFSSLIMLDRDLLNEYLHKLRNWKWSSGVKVIAALVCTKNFPMKRVASRAGFLPLDWYKIGEKYKWQLMVAQRA